MHVELLWSTPEQPGLFGRIVGPATSLTETVCAATIGAEAVRVETISAERVCAVVRIVAKGRTMRVHKLCFFILDPLAKKDDEKI